MVTNTFAQRRSEDEVGDEYTKRPIQWRQKDAGLTRQTLLPQLPLADEEEILELRKQNKNTE